MATNIKSKLILVSFLLLGFCSLLVLVVVIRTFTLAFRTDTFPKCNESDADFIKAGDRIIGRFQRALQFKTISYENGNIDVEEFDKIVLFIQKEFPTIHSSPMVKFEIISKYSLLYTLKGKNPSLAPYMLVAHLDVVPVEPEKWEVPPFSGEIKDEYIYGRGTVDFKNAVMGIMESLEFLLDRGFQPNRTFYIAFGHDEEIGGTKGAKEISKVLESRKVQLEYILDEGLTVVDGVVEGMEIPVALIGVSEKGYADLKLSVKGTGGHSSMPPRMTSVGILATAIGRLEENLHPNMFGRGPEVDMLEQLTPYFTPPYKVVMSNLWLFGPIIARSFAGKPSSNAMIRTVTATTIFRGGIKRNVIPLEATALINHRIHPLQTLEEVLEFDKRVINDDRVKIEVINSVKPHPFSSYSDDAFGFQTLRISIQQVWHGIPVAPGLMIGNTDSKHYLHLTKAAYRFSPTYNRPIDLPRFHGNNERMSIKNYEQTINFYKHVILNSDHENLPNLRKRSDEL